MADHKKIEETAHALINPRNSNPLTNFVQAKGSKYGYTDLLPSTGGLYAFWIDLTNIEIDQLQCKVLIKGPAEREILLDWDWALKNDLVLVYVGKTTNLRNRLSMHLLLNSPSFGRKDRLNKKTTSCQFRAGYEHLFFTYPLAFVPDGLKITRFTSIDLDGDENIANRFYAEDLAIGLGRPIFNLDSER